MNVLSKIEPLLLQAQKPAQYIGGEMGSVIKKREDVDVRFAFCFPDTYEIGMSHLGMKILYSLINARENFWCERIAPCADFEALMRQNEILLYALESLMLSGTLILWDLPCNMSFYQYSEYAGSGWNTATPVTVEKRLRRWWWQARASVIRNRWQIS
ncbi:MAG: hypothetical protein ACLR5S_04905 [Ruminococcus sp.]